MPKDNEFANSLSLFNHLAKEDDENLINYVKKLNDYIREIDDRIAAFPKNVKKHYIAFSFPPTESMGTGPFSVTQLERWQDQMREGLEMLQQVINNKALLTKDDIEHLEALPNSIAEIFKPHQSRPIR